jgi:hypothetical protein
VPPAVRPAAGRHAHLFALGDAVGGNESTAHGTPRGNFNRIRLAEQTAEAGLRFGAETNVLELAPATRRKSNTRPMRSPKVAAARNTSNSRRRNSR